MKLRTFLRSSIIVLKYIILGKSYYSKKKEGKSSYLTQKERDEWFRKNIENKVPDKVKPAARLENVEKKPWLQDEKKDKIKTALVVQLITIAVIISIVLGPMTFWETPTPVFAENLNFLFKFGDSGSGEDPSKFPDGALFKPSGIELFDGKIYITDENNHVQVFDSSGEFLFKFGKCTHEEMMRQYHLVDDAHTVGLLENASKDQLDQLARHFNIEITDAGYIYQLLPLMVNEGLDTEFIKSVLGESKASEKELVRKYVKTEEREQVCGHGKNEWGVGHGDGELHEPSDVTVDKSGKIYVADMQHAEVQVFDSSGKFLFKFGGGTTCEYINNIQAT